jgi:3-hydroxyisobutyrate dehydrogenase
MNTLQPGWVGVGNMGNAIVLNLQKKGFKVKTFNRTKEKQAKVTEAGALPQESLQQLVHNCSIIFTMVSDDEAVKEVYAGEQGLLSHGPGGKIFVDMSTVSPHTSRHLANLCNDIGNHFIDAPVSGSVGPAEEGNLLIMAGGPFHAFENVKPIFDAIGKLSIHLGDNGAGSSAKLAINYLLGLNLQGLAETVVFAEENGIKAQDILTIINEGALANGITKGKTASILNNEFPAAFALKHLAKDLRLAGEQGLRTPLFRPLSNSFEQAVQNGLGEKDVMAILTYVKESLQIRSENINLYPDDNVSDYAN